MISLTDGQTVYLSCASERSSDGKPFASVVRGTVINAEHRVVMRDGGYVSAIQDWNADEVHATEAEAWAANAIFLSVRVGAIAAKAEECERLAAQAAAAASIVAVPA